VKSSGLSDCLVWLVCAVAEQHKALAEGASVESTPASSSAPGALHLTSPHRRRSMERPAACVQAVPAREAAARAKAATPLTETTAEGDELAASVPKSSRDENVIGQSGRAWRGKLVVASVCLAALGCLSLTHVFRLSHLSPTPRSLLPSAPAASRAGDYLDPARQRRLDAPFSGVEKGAGVEGVQSDDEEEEMIM